MSDEEFAVVEPLAESAPVARGMAASLCAPNLDGDGTCAWYHGYWQYWRLVGLSPGCGGQGRFLIETLRAMARDRRRVLVSGCGDYSLPAHVLRAYELAGADVDLTVIDRCETPLFLTRWYADRQGRPVTTHRSDAREYESASRFDVVVSNSFLSYFDADGRQRLFGTWHRLLRPGGKVVLTNRVRPGVGPALRGFGPEEVRSFVDAACRAADGWLDRLGVEEEQVADWARTWATRFRAYPVRGVDEIETPLREAGFVPDLLEVDSYRGAVETYPAQHGSELTPSGATRGSGPAASGAVPQARVVATRGV